MGRTSLSSKCSLEVAIKAIECFFYSFLNHTAARQGFNTSIYVYVFYYPCLRYLFLGFNYADLWLVIFTILQR
jgi:hypothetical protein